MANLQFKRVSTLPTIGANDIGTIYFNTTSHTISVATAAGKSEEYGGNIEDVTFLNGKLTIKKRVYSSTADNDGYSASNPIVLDFSDVASSSDVSKVCSALASRVSTLESNVATNTSTISRNTSRIEALEDKASSSSSDVSGLTERVTTVEGKVKNLETTVGDSSEGLVHDVAANTSSISTLSSNKANINGDQSKTFSVASPTNGEHAANKTYVDNQISTAIASAYKVKGSCTYEELVKKTSGNTVGDVWNVTTSNGKDVGNPDYVPAGTNYVWSDENKWDPLGGTIDLSTYATSSTVAGVADRVTALENKTSKVVNTFGGEDGTITVDTSQKTNGHVKFTMSEKNLTATVVGINNAAYKDVITSVTANSDNLVTSGAVSSVISSLHSSVQSEIKSNTQMTWAQF